MKCQARWIGLDGKPTPDENPAVAIAHAHKALWSHPGGHPDNRIVGYSTTEIAESFPICADHLPQLRGLKGWSVSPLPVEAL